MTARKEERLAFRIPKEAKELIERAANEQFQTVSDFATTTLVEESRRVLENAQVLRLSARDRDVFLAMLDNDEPNAALSEAASEYRRQIEEAESKLE